ncbi:OmpH family outer membrane protein [Mucilaginibacter sp. dw_454]|uniref:OmpH family outer membrane protein n=1 Tax=Mucilaginibacter sp. dw_454 TaxID=2720079 RepID=UPI001BD3D3A5|nr:OmpH family outer membrane protein [Mucilaginibacter sp. dw_454]
MKKVFKVALVAVCMLFIGNFAKAQTKIGYISYNDLIPAMPEYKTVNTQIEAFKKTFVDQLQLLSNELQTKGADYQAKQATMTDAVKAAKQSELADLQKRAQDYQNTAQQSVEQKGNDLMKPLLDKARAAVTEVAKEKGLTYVFDSSTTQLLVSPPSDDIMAAVKVKLGISSTPTSTTTK